MKKISNALALLALLALPLGAAADDPAGAAGEATKKADLLFVTTTGLEDVQSLSSSFRHAATAKKSAHVDEVVWLGYGRSVVVFDPTVSAVPASVREQAEAAKKAGVRIVLCAQALRKYDIDPAKLPAGVEVVPNAIDELGRLAAQGFSVVNY